MFVEADEPFVCLSFQNPLPPVGRGKHKRHWQQGDILGDYVYVGPKTQGVEPGFLGVSVHTLSTFLLLGHALYPNTPEHRQIRDDLMPWSAVFSKESTDSSILQEHQVRHPSLLESFMECELKTKARLLCAMEQVIKDGSFQLYIQKHLAESPRFAKLNPALYLFKYNYNDPNWQGRVTISKEDAMRTQSVQRMPQWIQPTYVWLYQQSRLRSLKQSNTNALVEVIANSVALASGAQGQRQVLVVGRYANDHPKLLTRSDWNDEIQGLGPLGGGTIRHGNVFVATCKHDGAPFRTNKGLLLSHPERSQIGREKVIGLLLNDRDMLGSRGANKMRLGLDMFWLDCGQALRGPNTIVNELRDDFTFEQPRQREALFKNFDAFDDSPFSERMMGVFFLQTMFRSPEDYQSPNEVILESYGEAFCERMSRIQVGAGIAVFDKAIHMLETALEELRDNSVFGHSHRAIAELEEKVKLVQKLQAQTIRAAQSLISVFRDKLNLPAYCVDSLRTLEALTSPTSLFSPDGTVLLNHLRITKRLRWSVYRTEEDFLFTFGASCSSPQHARTLVEEMNTFFVTQQLRVSIRVQGTELLLSLLEQHAGAFFALMSTEDAVQQYKHPDDFDQRKQAFLEFRRQQEEA